MALEVAPTDAKLITGDDLAAMDDSESCELVEGRIVRMGPTGDEHGGIELNIAAEILEFVREHNLGKVRVGEVGIYTGRDPDTIRAADVLFISHERYAQKRSESYLDIAPDLIVEILSPNDSLTDVTQKMREYFAIGVRLIWVVDPKARKVYAYRSLTDVREFNENDNLPGDEVLVGFAVKVAQLFGV